MLRKFLLLNPYRQIDHPAVFSYDEEKDEFHISIKQGTRPSELPAIPKVLMQKGVYEIDDKYARIFVKERVIPPERQNIGEIMRKVGITKYNEFALLEYCSGKSCMDDFYLEEITDDENDLMKMNQFT